MPRQELMTRWQKERSYFLNAPLYRPQPPNKKHEIWPWESAEPTESRNYTAWLKEVVNPATDEYYTVRVKKVKDVQEDGTEIFEDVDVGPEQIINQIARLRVEDGKEFLITNGEFWGYDRFGQKHQFSYSRAEEYFEYTFKYENQVDARTMTMLSVCHGVDGRIPHYTMPFSHSNVDKLWSKRNKKGCALVVKDLLTDEGKGCGAWNGVSAIDMFKTKSFDYIKNMDYMTEKEKQETLERHKATVLGTKTK